VWTLKYQDVRLKPCPRKPPKGELVDAIIEAVNSKMGGNVDFGIEMGKQDIEYLLVILSSMNPEHPFFATDYMPPSKNGVRLF
jgi:hypothetical protein